MIKTIYSLLAISILTILSSLNTFAQTNTKTSLNDQVIPAVTEQILIPDDNTSPKNINNNRNSLNNSIIDETALNQINTNLLSPENPLLSDHTILKTSTSVIDLSNDYPLPISGKELKENFQGSKIYQYDNSPIGLRQPILFVHGGGGEHQELFRWDKLIPYLTQNQNFQKKYKVYLIRYDSKLLLSQIMPEIKEVIIKLYDNTGKKPLRLVALSMGGNVAQRLLANTQVDHMIAQVFAMGSPFHGSPLFCSDWFSYSLYKRHHLAAVKVLDNVEYKEYFKFHKNYQTDLGWDDDDNAMPITSSFHSNLPLGPKGVLNRKEANNGLSAIVNEDALDKQKIITYAGYLINPYIINTPNKGILHKIRIGLYQFKTFLIAQTANELAALKLLNMEIAQMVANNPNDQQQSKSKVNKGYEYGLNDGITPVSSAIFLPPHALKSYPLVNESELIHVSKVTDVKVARVFRNINHVTFVDGPPKHGTKYLVDELHPNEPKQTIFNWILNELLNT